MKRLVAENRALDQRREAADEELAALQGALQGRRDACVALEMRVEALEGQLLSERRAASELKAQWDAEADALRHEAEDRGRALEEAERLELNARLQSAAAEHMRRLEQEVSRLKDEHAAELLALEARRR